MFPPHHLERLGLDQGQIATDSGIAPVAGAVRVAISGETDAGGDLGFVKTSHRSACLGGDMDVFKASRHGN